MDKPFTFKRGDRTIIHQSIEMHSAFYVIGKNKSLQVFEKHFNRDAFRFLQIDEQKNIVNCCENLKKMYSFFDEWLELNNLETYLYPFISKIIFNLLSYNSLYQGEHNIDICSLNNAYKSNRKALLMFACKYLSANPTKLSRQQKRKSSVQDHQMMAGLLYYIKKIYNHLVSQINEDSSFVNKLKMILEEQFAIICDFLRSKVKNIPLSNESQPQIRNNISKILLYKLIRKQLLSIYQQTFSQPYSLYTKECSSLIYSKVLAYQSGISNFLNIRYEQQKGPETVTSIYEQSNLTSIQVAGLLQGLQALNKVKIINESSLSDHFDIFFRIDLLRFIQKTLQIGLKIKVQRDNLYICEGRVKYQVRQAFAFTKHIRILEQKCPSLYNLLKSYLKDQKDQRNNSIYSENDLSQRRRDRFIQTKKTQSVALKINYSSNHKSQYNLLPYDNQNI